MCAKLRHVVPCPSPAYGWVVTLPPDTLTLRFAAPATLPALARTDLLQPGTFGTWVESPGAPRTFTRNAPEFVDDPSNTNLLPGFGAATYTSPPVTVTAMDGATLFGYRAIMAHGVVCTDEPGGDPAADAALAAKLSQADAFANEDTGLIRTAVPGEFTLPTAGRGRRSVAGTNLSLCSHEPSNYGSLLFRVVPKLATAEALDLRGLPVVAWVGNPAFRAVLELCGVEPQYLVPHEPWMLTTFDRLVAPALRNPHGFLDGDSTDFMQRLAARQPSRRGRRLYVSRLGQARRGASSRVLINEAEVAAAMADLGFDVFEPEAHAPAEQVAAFASADIVVGPAGSGMFNTVFCRPGTKVIDMESEVHWVYAHAGLFASCKLRYGLFLGQVDPADPNTVHRRWTADVPALISRVKSWI